MRYKLSFGRYKIFIIDEVYMFIIEVFNAFLKILEELFSYVKFFLVIMDVLKLFVIIFSCI